MPYVFKTNELDSLPIKGRNYSLTSRYSDAKNNIRSGETIYVFVEDRTALGRYGGLVGRGSILSANHTDHEIQLDIVFDCTSITIPLETRSLHRFAHPQQYSLPEFEHESIAQIQPLLTEIAKTRRKTTNQPIHEISDEAADWLNLYHLKKEKH